MTFTYNAGAAMPKDDIRFEIGDTDTGAQENLRLEDEEISRIVLRLSGTATPGETGVLRAAAACARALAAKFARAFEGSSSGPGPSRTRAQELQAVARALDQRASAGAALVAGGISRADKEARAADPDRVPSTFRRGMLDNPDGSSS